MSSPNSRRGSRRRTLRRRGAGIDGDRTPQSGGRPFASPDTVGTHLADHGSGQRRVTPQGSGGGASGGGRFHRGPQFGAQSIGARWLEVIRDNDALDHVGDHRPAWPIVQPDRHHRAVRTAANRSVDADQAGRTPEARADKASPTRLAGEGAGGGSELDGGDGLHTQTIMTKGYDGVAGLPGVRRSLRSGGHDPPTGSHREERYSRRRPISERGRCRCRRAIRWSQGGHPRSAPRRAARRTRGADRDPRPGTALRPRIRRRGRSW